MKGIDMTHDRNLMISSRPAFFSVLAALNVSVISFYVLWSIADSITVNRAAHASLLSLMALDVLVFMAWRRSRRHVPQQPDVINGALPHDHVTHQ